MIVEEIKKKILGGWKSISTEVRPSALKDEKGNPKPFYLARDFEYKEGDGFSLKIINSADPFGKIPLAEIFITGHVSWLGDHPVAPNAQKVDFTADEGYDVTPLLPAFADVLNQVAKKGFDKWEVGESQSVFRKEFAPFGLSDGQIFKEFDLIYYYQEFLFWGSRHVDGSGFDTNEHRPTNLQVPLIRK